MNTCIFIERDGVLNRVRTIHTSQIQPARLEDFIINTDAVEPLQCLKKAGFQLIVTTSQPGLSNGFLGRQEMEQMHVKLRQWFPVDDIMVCPHGAEDRCDCRKPKSGLFREAAFKYHIDMDGSYVISDKWQDAMAAHYVGCTSLLLRSPLNGSGHHDYILPTLSLIAAKILELHSMRMAYLVHA
jgi:D-glycero-D-manno-heptose 1,7-bisphosphate phosphatase